MSISYSSLFVFFTYIPTYVVYVPLTVEQAKQFYGVYGKSKCGIERNEYFLYRLSRLAEVFATYLIDSCKFK